MALTGFHFSTGGAGGLGCSGGFEAPLGGVPSPPPSPDAGPRDRRPGLKARSRSGDEALNIKERGESLFCETMKTVFLVERNSGHASSLSMEVQNSNSNRHSQGVDIPRTGGPVVQHGLATPSPSPDGRTYPETGTAVKEYVEVFDYNGGARFRGFVAEKEDERSMFIFFDKEVLGKDLKPGLMALLELSDFFECSRLMICVDRFGSEDDVKETTRDLGWVGFELATLAEYAGERGGLSDSWLFFSMDV
ncbi:hypothetical protein LTR17_027334 [Elasticomyces elasticus]|nr:hypothetical protein LTR17_027334 [Elasticomyces elasticus]